MRILFDQGTPVNIKPYLPGHTIKTAYQQGWSTLSNGELLQAAESAGFDLLLTTDQNLVYQQNLTTRKIAIVALSKNRWSLIEPVLPQIIAAVNVATAGSYILVEIAGG
jgi:hypothetical protein